MWSEAMGQDQQQTITSSNLPLAVYREVAAHLRQVESVDADLIMRSIEPNSQAKFDYNQSQIAALQISYGENINLAAQEQVREILDYYGQRYQPWQDFVEGDSQNEELIEK